MRSNATWPIRTPVPGSVLPVITHTRLAGPRLAGNLLGDPTERDLYVYLPPGYEDSDERYPTAYLLHYFGSSAQELVYPRADKERWSPPLQDVLDPVFTRLNTPPMIVVIPDGWTSYGCGQWVDSPVGGNFESYLLHDVVTHVDEHFRTIPQASSRGVFGFSSGGFGAWHVVSRHPEAFSALAMLSGDSYFDLTHKPMLYEYLDSIWPEAPKGPVEAIYMSQMIYALASCYSPNPDNPPYYVDLPMDFPSGEIKSEVWNQWLSFDPVVNWRDRFDNLRQLKGILLDVGARDDISLQWGHRLLSHYLGEAGIVHEASEHAGNHGSRSRERYQVSLQWLATVLERGGA